jgi:hypothetical protein
MQSAVRSAWRRFNEPLERLTNWMYLDIKGLVTTGMGNLIDPIEAALRLTWHGADGSTAAPDVVRHEWRRIKTNLALAHLGAQAARRVATLHLDAADIDTLILDKLDHDEAILKANPAFADFDDWPADAQLGLLSMGWAMGPGFGSRFPHFSTACAAGDFTTAAKDCAISTIGNPGVARRNAANRQAFLFAASTLDPATLRSRIPPL